VAGTVVGMGAEPNVNALNGLNALAAGDRFADPWQPIGDGMYLGTAPSTKFPLYTRGNAGEVFPEVQYPLSFTQNWETSTAAFEAAAISTGVITAADLGGEVSAMTGVFGGYTYLNVSVQRLVAARAPGTDVASVDQQYLGASDAPPYVATRGDRRLRSSLAALRYGLRTLRTKALPQLAVDQRVVQRWLATRPNFASASDADLVDFVRAAVPLGAELFQRHLTISSQAAVPAGLLVQQCTKLGRPDLPARLMAGVGDVASAAPSTALWDLGRTVANESSLTAQFDDGLGGLESRLRVDPACSSFVASFDAFLAEFGNRGPNEWETACETWGTDPHLPLALIDRMRHADAAHAPVVRHAHLVTERNATLAALAPRARRRLAKTVASTAFFARSRERSKTTVIEYLHGARLVLKELDRRVNERSGGAKNDLWFVTVAELDDYLAEPTRFAADIADRRHMRALLSALEPPFVINAATGVPPLSTWRRRDAAVSVGVVVGQVLTGIAGCPGIARGRARVILDPSDPTALGPGDILIAPLTDPAWTPLFVPSEAVVVDVGAMLSHAVIVARELGIPAVVSVTGATRIIPDGALIEVDGGAGTVTILELP
jgi:rifampicin phosphotransferase